MTPDSHRVRACDSEVIRAILSRASAVKLTDPGPDREEIETILAAGARAPDHGRLRPWRFTVVGGEGRQRLGEYFVEAMRRSQGSAISELRLDKERQKPLRAPLLIIVAAAVQWDHPKVPGIEQIIAVGAAVQNMILTANALGYASMWRTGEAAYSSVIKSVLGLNHEDQIVSFLYLGTALNPGRTRSADLSDCVHYL